MNYGEKKIARSIQRLSLLGLTNNNIYEDFISNNPSKGTLKVQAYSAKMAIPVPNAAVKVYKNFENGEKIFFEGITDESGIISDIILPTPSKVNSLTPNNSNLYSDYSLSISHPNYYPQLLDVIIYDGIESIMPVEMHLKEV